VSRRQVTGRGALRAVREISVLTTTLFSILYAAASLATSPGCLGVWLALGVIVSGWKALKLVATGLGAEAADAYCEEIEHAASIRRR
jgi:hypothetical protein